MKQILIVDDDVEIRSLLADYLQRNGFRVFTLPDGRGLWRELEERAIDLVVLDLMMPGVDGLALCRALRDRRSRLPVLMLSALGEDVDRIVGLETGADDYLPKPFHPRELLARVNAILKRSEQPEIAAGCQGLRFEGHELDMIKRELRRASGERLPLSSAEFDLLAIFLTRPNRVLSRDLLVELTQKREAPAYDRSIDVRVSRLRQILGDEAREQRLIQTVYGEGYIFAAQVEARLA
ncbi:DNA-binding response regulator [Betaproteobacteria bacterium GR16-43]|nr:DNA-binding response regulator [Betaproteobacteria bacterium GR16-43]